MSSSEPPLDLIVTVVSAKNLKNINWRNGDLKPYVVLYLDSENRFSTRPDDSASTKPVWNERIALPLTRSVHESVLNIEILHSNSTTDLTKSLVGSVRFPLARVTDSDELINSLELIRPSGRPQGKIRLKLSIKKRPIPPPQPQDYYYAPRGNHYYSQNPPQAPSPYPFSDHYYSGFYYPPPPPPSRSMYDLPSNYSLPRVPSAPTPPPPVGSRLSSYGVPGCPSAPVDYSPYDHRQLHKTMGGLSLEEERAVAERSESGFGDARPSYNYSREYPRER
ncbi:unnamed protein product [Cochlearia groenlandica]